MLIIWRWSLQLSLSPKLPLCVILYAVVDCVNGCKYCTLLWTQFSWVMSSAWDFKLMIMITVLIIVKAATLYFCNCILDGVQLKYICVEKRWVVVKINQGIVNCWVMVFGISLGVLINWLPSSWYFLCVLVSQYPWLCQVRDNCLLPPAVRVFWAELC